MEDPWSTGEQTTAGPGPYDPQGAGKRASWPWFTPRWFLPLAVVSALGALTTFFQGVATGPELLVTIVDDEPED